MNKEQIISRLKEIYNYYSILRDTKESKVYLEASIGNPIEKSRVYSKIREKVSYVFGVPKKYLTREVQTFGQLVNVTLKHRQKKRPSREDLEQEVKEFYELNLQL